MSGPDKTCAGCGKRLDPDALFCPTCGAPRSKSDDGDPLLGAVVGGRYLLLDRLGHGGSGSIYLAEHVTLRRKVAVKVLHHELSRDDLAVERFRREATTVGEIDNPHIVQIHDFGRTDDGRLYLAMEYLDGETLDARLGSHGKLDIDTTVDVLIQLGEALMEAHAIGYVHRDLRPRNVFLARRRNHANYVKLLDFGLAKLVASEGGEAATTSLGMTFGDPAYMSPEQARGEPIDRRADIYSLGCIAFEMLSGAPPFTGGRVFDILTRHVEEAPPDLPALREDVPDWLDQTVQCMLAKRPADRFVTVYRLCEALREGRERGVAMPVAQARRIETIPPPSISQAMERFTAPGSAPYEVDPSATEPNPEAAPAAQEPAPAAAPVPADPDATVPRKVPSLGDRTEPSPRSTLLSWKREDAGRAPEAAAAEAASSSGPSPAPPASSQRTSEPTPVPGRIASPVVTRIATPADSAPAQIDEASPPGGSGSALGKTTTSRGVGKNKKASSSAGISAAWFADGEALEQGTDVAPGHAEKLRRARSTPGYDDNTEETYFDERPRWKRGWIAGAIALGVLGIVGVAVAMSGGDDDGDAAADSAAVAAADDVQPPPAGAAAPGDAPATAGAADPAPGRAAADPAAIPDSDSPEVPAPAAGDSEGDTGHAEPVAARPAHEHATETAAHSRATAPDRDDEQKKTARTETTRANDSNRSTTSTPGHRSAEPVDPYGDPGGTETKPSPRDPYADTDSDPAGESADRAKADFYAKLGESAMRSGDYVAAATNFNKARQLNPSDATALAGLGEIALQQSAFSAAVTHLQKAARLRKSARTLTLLGEAYLGTGDDARAAEAFKSALKLNPDNPRARDGYNQATGSN